MCCDVLRLCTHCHSIGRRSIMTLGLQCIGPLLPPSPSYDDSYPIKQRSSPLISTQSFVSSPSKPFPSIFNTVRHDIPILPNSSPSHVDPRCTVKQQTDLQCPQHGPQFTAPIFSTVLPASLCHFGSRCPELYLRFLRELFVSPAEPYFASN